MKNLNTPQCFTDLMGAEIGAALHVKRLLSLASENREYVAQLAEKSGAPQYAVKLALTTGVDLQNITVHTAMRKANVCLQPMGTFRVKNVWLYIPFSACVDAVSFAKWLRAECSDLAKTSTEDLVRAELYARAHARRLTRLPAATLAFVKKSADTKEKAAAKKGGAS